MANEVFQNVLETLERNLSTKTTIGEPVTVGDVTLIPVMDLMFGYGGGGGEASGNKDQAGSGSGSGGGAGARLSPKAIIVIKDGEVQVLPFAKGGAMERIVASIPGLVEKFGHMKAHKEEAAAEPAAE